MKKPASEGRASEGSPYGYPASLRAGTGEADFERNQAGTDEAMTESGEGQQPAAEMDDASHVDESRPPLSGECPSRRQRVDAGEHYVGGNGQLLTIAWVHIILSELLGEE